VYSPAIDFVLFVPLFSRAWIPGGGTGTLKASNSFSLLDEGCAGRKSLDPSWKNASYFPARSTGRLKPGLNFLSVGNIYNLNTTSFE
jgi:hypothetical protein